MAIKFLLVEKCCFYIPLETGVKFFGFLSLSGSLMILLIECLELAYFKGGDKLLLGVALSTQVIQSAAALALLLGTYMRKPRLIPCWLLTTPIVAVLEFTILGNVTYHFFYIRQFQLDWFILNSITMIDDIYGWVVAYSYYYTLLTPAALPGAV